MASSDTRPAALVTGAAGFIGSHLVRELLRLGRVRVVALDDLSGGYRHNVADGAEFVEASVTDHATLACLFDKHQFRYVYHLAAYAAEGLSHFIRRFNYTNNVIGSINLINESVRHEVESFVFTSSIAVYGAVEPPMREDQMPRPEDPYGVAKYAVELDLAAAHEMFGLPYVVFRPHNVYGEYQNLGDPYRNVIGIFMNQVMTGRPLSVFGDGTQKRAFSYVGDIVPAIAQSPWVPAARCQIFNIGADIPYSVNELTEHVARAMGQPGHLVKYLPARNEVRVAFSDHGKAASVFGLGSQTPLAEGLSRMAAWARKVGIQSAKPFEGIEITRNLPPSWTAMIAASRSNPSMS
ncbi:MAG: NAD-dependent epimerase/dehydratase family protein [Isosphaeraceae bacterium]